LLQLVEGAHERERVSGAGQGTKVAISTLGREIAKTKVEQDDRLTRFIRQPP